MNKSGIRFHVFQVLRRGLIHALQKKRPGIPIERYILHQDNAPAHRADTIRLELDLMGLKTIDHSPYSSDLAPMDFAVFPEIKAQLKGRRFTSLEELTYSTHGIIRQFDSAWYQKVFSRCVECRDEYFEKR